MPVYKPHLLSSLSLEWKHRLHSFKTVHWLFICMIVLTSPCQTQLLQDFAVFLIIASKHIWFQSSFFKYKKTTFAESTVILWEKCYFLGEWRSNEQSCKGLLINKCYAGNHSSKLWLTSLAMRFKSCFLLFLLVFTICGGTCWFKDSKIVGRLKHKHTAIKD